jgi:hypothetical protein
MTAITLDAHDWIHSSARCICREWIIDMHDAAAAGSIVTLGADR